MSLSKKPIPGDKVSCAELLDFLLRWGDDNSPVYAIYNGMPCKMQTMQRHFLVGLDALDSYPHYCALIPNDITLEITNIRTIEARVLAVEELENKVWLFDSTAGRVIVTNSPSKTYWDTGDPNIFESYKPTPRDMYMEKYVGKAIAACVKASSNLDHFSNYQSNSKSRSHYRAVETYWGQHSSLRSAAVNMKKFWRL